MDQVEFSQKYAQNRIVMTSYGQLHVYKCENMRKMAKICEFWGKYMYFWSRTCVYMEEYVRIVTHYMDLLPIACVD